MDREVLLNLAIDDLHNIVADPQTFILNHDAIKDLAKVVASESEKLLNACKHNVQQQQILADKQKELFNAQNKLSDIYMEYQQEWIKYLGLVDGHSFESKKIKLGQLQSDLKASSDSIGKKAYDDQFISEYKSSRESYYNIHLKYDSL